MSAALMAVPHRAPADAGGPWHPASAGSNREVWLP